ncbi:hypothetical protein PPERSA_08434 [Pseudocohnilembus persalinus]|uniref:Tyrosine specific protein phosphatases domain-containing protein n=1 Tax=Pseudocohnilembus persalinus TaxID=266149 RepID=A0A0V0R6A4_PSEPJ|nr:hypothetical protein PPERSA_08434 [Pseudocohnilembus persalinus]|eukprot:KRX10031.1 hypothetical protein PPERSA_08434 [Pseudocohnilembus persalinus]
MIQDNNSNDQKYVCVQYVLTQQEYQNQAQFFEDIAKSQNISSYKLIKNLSIQELENQNFIQDNNIKKQYKPSEDFDQLDLEFKVEQDTSDIENEQKIFNQDITRNKSQEKQEQQQLLEKNIKKNDEYQKQENQNKNKENKENPLQESDEKNQYLQQQEEDIVIVNNEEDDDTFIIQDYQEEFEDKDDAKSSNKKKSLKGDKQKDFEQIKDEDEREKLYRSEKYQRKIQKLKQGCYSWFQSSKYGDVVEGTNIIPGKTPLLKPFWKKIFDNEDERLYFGKMLEELKSKGTPIRLIIDLTEQNKYYTFNKLKKNPRFGLTEILKDVEYYHYPLSIHNPPRKTEMNKLYSEINKHATKKNFYIFLHCFCGINRTGYVTSYFLGRSKNLKSDECIKRFEKARGAKFNRQNLVQDLQEKFDF